VLGVLRFWLSQRGRNRDIDLAALLRCPACHAESMKASGTTIRCEGCGERYEIKDGIPRLARN
jgi:uncharacterized protein YbaR (Trm112 family)